MFTQQFKVQMQDVQVRVYGPAVVYNTVSQLLRRVNCNSQNSPVSS